MIKVYYDLPGNHPKWILFNHKWQKIKSYLNQPYFNSGVESLDYVFTEVKNKFNRHTSIESTTNKYERYALLGGSEYKEWFVCVNQWPKNFIDPHFQIHNLLFHIRSSVWKDTCGSRCLLIDEIQSDWHNALRHDEYGGIAEMPYEKKWIELAIKVVLEIAIRGGYKSVCFTTSKMYDECYKGKYKVFEILYDK